MTNARNDLAIDDMPPSASTDEMLKWLVVDDVYWDSRLDASTVMREATDGTVAADCRRCRFPQ